MSSRTDSWFPPEDSGEEGRRLKRAGLKIMHGVWRHLTGGGGGTAEDNNSIAKDVARFLHEDS